MDRELAPRQAQEASKLPCATSKKIEKRSTAASKSCSNLDLTVGGHSLVCLHTFDSIDVDIAIRWRSDAWSALKVGDALCAEYAHQYTGRSLVDSPLSPCHRRQGVGTSRGPSPSTARGTAVSLQQIQTSNRPLKQGWDLSSHSRHGTLSPDGRPCRSECRYNSRSTHCRASAVVSRRSQVVGVHR